MTQKMTITLVLIVIVATLVGITGYLVFLNRSEVPKGVFTTTVQPTDKDERVNKSANWSCIPSDINPDTAAVGMGADYSLARYLTILKAHCDSTGKLVDASEKEIYFHRATSCGGTLVQGEQERENARIRELKKQYTVIQLGCWPVNYRGPFPP